MLVNSVMLALILLTPSEEHSSVQMYYSGPDGCSFTVDVSEPEFMSFHDHWYPVVRGMDNTYGEGEYVLPSMVVYVPVPPGTEPRLDYSVIDQRRISLPEPMLITPELTGSGLDTRLSIPEAATAAHSEHVEVDVIRMAGISVARVTVRPLAGSDPGLLPGQIDVRLSWPSSGGARRIDRALIRNLCPFSDTYWPAERTRATSQFWGLPWARIAVDLTGVYLITGDELEDSGCQVTGSPSATLRMFTGPGRQFLLDDPAEEHQLREIPIEVLDGGDGMFDGSDTLKFFGLGLGRMEFVEGVYTRLYHRYAEKNVYWLSWGAENGMRVDTVGAFPDASPQWGDSLDFSIWQEQNYYWVAGQERNTGWTWTQLFDGMPNYLYFSSPSADGYGSIEVSVVPAYGNYGPHRIILELNGSLVLDTTWTVSDDAATLSADSLVLDPSMNLLEVTSVDDPENIYLDYFHAEYPRRLSFAANRILQFPVGTSGRYTFDLGGGISSTSLLDITDPFEPVRLEGEMDGALLETSLDVNGSSRFWLEGEEGYRKPDSIVPASPGRIVGSGMEGDVAIVVADALLEASQPLQAIYGARGQSVALVTTSEVYNEFGQGLRDPGAIRSFFRFTQDSWSEPAEALLLVGDGSYDPLMHITPTPTLIPVCLFLYSDDGDNLDDCYVMAHEGSDLPEAPVSRISASSPSELMAYLSKIMTYQSGSSPGQWENRVVLAADDEWGGVSTNEDEHTLSCEILADSILPRSLERVKFYLIEYPWPPGTTPPIHPEKPEAHEDFVELLSHGCASMIFFGHGSYGQLAHEKLMVSSDVQLIDNGNRQPVMIFASCDLGHFDLISANCLAEDFELKPEAGSIVSIGATRGTFPSPSMQLYNRYFQNIYDYGLSVGDALWLAKVQVTGGYFSNRYYVVLGDGGLSQVYPSGAGSFQFQGDTLCRGRVNHFTGQLQHSSSAFVNVTESGREMVYICLGSDSISYLRYGSSVFNGLVTGSGGDFSSSFFMPVQADTGHYSRGSLLGISQEGSEVSFREWVPTLDLGDHYADSTPPCIDLWIQGSRGEDQPSVDEDAVLKAEISDSSGICTMGDGAGRSILLSLDSQGFDVSGYFTYDPNSYTSGTLEYDLPEMIQGQHRIIVAAWDGLGNTGRDTLDFNVVSSSQDLLSSVFVYPNPGYGQRCFNFDAAVSGQATISVYTVAGRRIWRKTIQCEDGYNQVLWDGRDMDGDELGSGSYIYRVEYESSEGSSDSVADIVAVIREQ